MLHILFVFSLTLTVTSTQVLAQDFCVADLASGIVTPSGYPCKMETNLTSDDFAFSGLGLAGNTSNIISAAVTPGIRGSIPRRQRPGYIRCTARPGSRWCSPNAHSPWSHRASLRGLLHFQINAAGRRPSLAIVTFNSPNPGLQILDFALFANDLPSSLLEKSTFLDDAQVKKLKGVLGGTG
ncbi:hypothetical protein V6N11_047366 [Hibiscus sabdariffa]|uniref:Uncharacterized protein n=2 Tax=Hibiscus sabdariffa TaxID=183260 RepID=A0ABR2AS88_9ROSI